jgi:hypothetical protein
VLCGGWIGADVESGSLSGLYSIQATRVGSKVGLEGHVKGTGRSLECWPRAMLAQTQIEFDRDVKAYRLRGNSRGVSMVPAVTIGPAVTILKALGQSKENVAAANASCLSLASRAHTQGAGQHMGHLFDPAAAGTACCCHVRHKICACKPQLNVRHKVCACEPLCTSLPPALASDAKVLDGPYLMDPIDGPDLTDGPDSTDGPNLMDLLLPCLCTFNHPYKLQLKCPRKSTLCTSLTDPGIRSGG